MAFSPWDAGRLACVGPALTFWRLQQHGASTGLQVEGSREVLGLGLVGGGVLTKPVPPLQVHQAPVPKAVGAGELTSMCFGAEPLLYCGSNCGQVCVWDMLAQRCFLTWEADDGEIGVCLAVAADSLRAPHVRLGAGLTLLYLQGCCSAQAPGWSVAATPGDCGCGLWGPCRSCAAGARVPGELWPDGKGPPRGLGRPTPARYPPRSSSVSMERELSLDGAVVSAVFHGSMDMGVVGTTAGTLWYVSWAEGTSTRLISGHRSKVRPLDSQSPAPAAGPELRDVETLRRRTLPPRMNHPST